MEAGDKKRKGGEAGFSAWSFLSSSPWNMWNDSRVTVLFDWVSSLFSLKLNFFWLWSTSGRKPGSCAGFLCEEVLMQTFSYKVLFHSDDKQLPNIIDRPVLCCIIPPSWQKSLTFTPSLWVKEEPWLLLWRAFRLFCARMKHLLALTKKSRSFLASPWWEPANWLTKQQAAVWCQCF